jgi:prevent-host-death family protein
MESYNIHAAKTHLSKLIEEALKGKDIVISRNGEPMVHLTPYKKVTSEKPRQGGQWTGKVWYAPEMFEDSEIFPKD